MLKENSKILILLVLILMCFEFGCTKQKDIKKSISNNNKSIENFKTTIIIEELTKPKDILQILSYEDVLHELIKINNSENGADLNEFSKHPFGIIAHSKNIDSLVSYGSHPFFMGMYQAYIDHRPFTLSPDMIWLLICQGFAHHVNNNAEDLRSLFVSFKGKQSLLVKNESIKLDDPNSPWEEAFPEFTKQIGDNVGKELIDVLSCNFSTSTSIEKVASEITAMTTFKSYFEYIIALAGCGIPSVTIEGTPEDWQKVYDKALLLKKYKLAWWIDELEPVLKQFIAASKGKPDKDFWRNMFKYHTLKEYGSPKIIDGWVVKLFPYNKSGKRNDLKSIPENASDLPAEIVQVDLLAIEKFGLSTIKKTPLLLWAGFIGLKQDPMTFTLTPKIGWMITEKSKDNRLSNINDQNRISLRINKFPPELLYLQTPNATWDLNFVDTINFPDEIRNVKIKRLEVFGKLSKNGAEHLKKLLSHMDYTINTYDFSMRNDVSDSLNPIFKYSERNPSKK